MLCALILLALGIAGTITFVACGDEEKENKKERNIQAKTVYTDAEVYNPENPYDQYAGCYDIFVENLTEILGLDLDENEYSEEINRRIDSLIMEYPEINTSSYSSDDIEFFQDFIRGFLSNVGNLGVVLASRNAENDLLSLSDSMIKNDLLCFISELKYGTSITIYYANSAWETRLDNCIRYELSQIFDNGSWYDQATFLAGLPGSFMKIVASCTYAATFNQKDPRCHY